VIPLHHRTSGSETYSNIHMQPILSSLLFRLDSVEASFAVHSFITLLSSLSRLSLPFPLVHYLTSLDTTTPSPSLSRSLLHTPPSLPLPSRLHPTLVSSLVSLSHPPLLSLSFLHRIPTRRSLAYAFPLCLSLLISSSLVLGLDSLPFALCLSFSRVLVFWLERSSVGGKGRGRRATFLFCFFRLGSGFTLFARCSCFLYIVYLVGQSVLVVGGRGRLGLGGRMNGVCD